MTSSAPPGRTIVIKARRDTLALVAAAVAMTFALSSVIHSRPAPSSETERPHQAWAGNLAPVSAVAPVSVEPMTSASLVLAKSELSLPAMNVRALVKLRGCEDSLCAPRPAPPVPARRPVADVAVNPTKATVARKDKPGLMARFNPLKHLPDVSGIGKPFVYAGDAVSGWFRHF